MPKQMSDLSAMKKFFGPRPGEGLKGFAEELKQLTAQDKKELGELCRVELGEN